MDVGKGSSLDIEADPSFQLATLIGRKRQLLKAEIGLKQVDLVFFSYLMLNDDCILEMRLDKQHVYSIGCAFQVLFEQS